jgi:hypothetical protein
VEGDGASGGGVAVAGEASENTRATTALAKDGTNFPEGGTQQSPRGSVASQRNPTVSGSPIDVKSAVSSKMGSRFGGGSIVGALPVAGAHAVKSLRAIEEDEERKEKEQAVMEADVGPVLNDLKGTDGNAGRHLLHQKQKELAVRELGTL